MISFSIFCAEARSKNYLGKSDSIEDDITITSFADPEGSVLIDDVCIELSPEKEKPPPVPKPRMTPMTYKNPRPSKDESFSSSFTINNSFEAESYFKKQAEKLLDRPEDMLEVEVPDPSPVRELSVKPLLEEAMADSSNLKNVVTTVRDLSEEPNLGVKPSKDQYPLSSFEALYDTTELESVPGTVKMTAEELQDSLGDRFKGTTFTDLEGASGGISSFENIYQMDPEGSEFFITTSSGSGADSHQLPNSRWSAPANTIEPPIICSQEFANRFGAIQEQIEGHWSNIEGMVDRKEQSQQQPQQGQQQSKEQEIGGG